MGEKKTTTGDYPPNGKVLGAGGSKERNSVILGA